MKHASKPWITTAIRKSIQVRDKILKKFIRLKDKSSRDLRRSHLISSFPFASFRSGINETLTTPGICGKI